MSHLTEFDPPKALLKHYPGTELIRIITLAEWKALLMDSLNQTISVAEDFFQTQNKIVTERRLLGKNTV